MRPTLLDYGLRTSRKEWIVRKLKFIAIGVALVCVAFAVYYMYVTISYDIWLGREEKRLLTANAPSAMFPSLNVQFSPNGGVILPDGKVARLAEIDLSDTGDQQRLSKDFSSVIRLIKAQKLGYTINGFDSTGVPVVHVWALSQNEYGPLCGNTGHETRRIFSWLLWRNVNATLVGQKGFVGNGNQAEREVERAKVNY